MSAAQQAVAEQIMAGPRGEVRGPFIALLHHPGLAGKLQALGEELRWKSGLPKRLLELAVLITARRWTCQHEWFMHEKLAREAGLQAAIIAAVAQRSFPKGAPPEEAAVHAFCLEAHESGRVSDAAFEAVKQRFGLEGALELLVACGYYSLMAMVLNTAG
ncbi:MAG TPA: carboxymuconolactone decarboxylase family protein, partial [Myxococcota bacterium]|nr:carboxymuconolactone decarboxylase family protein [Myxococcota bacterium]